MHYQKWHFMQKLWRLNRTQRPKLVLMALLITGMAACQAVQAMPATQGETEQKAAKQGQCTLATLKGRYLVANSGPILPPAFGVTESTPGADAGFHVFNGDGTGTDTVTFRVNGVIVLENFVTPVSYTVNADCTGTITVPDGPTFGIFVAPNGDYIASTATDPGNYATGINPRVAPE